MSRDRTWRPTWRQALNATWGLILVAGMGPAHAQALAQDEAWAQALARSPRWQAALQMHRAAQARADASGGNPNDWTPQASWARRSQRTEPGQVAAAAEREWSIGLSRGLRLPGKVAAAEDWAQRQRESADAERAQAWLQLCREALSDAGELALAQQQASLWRAHADNLTTQHETLRRRHELGDAARQDMVLADAARAQAQSQATLAEQRARASQARWLARYPGLGAPALQALAAEPAAGASPDDTDDTETRLMQHPAWLAAEHRVLALKAQARHAQADRQPDPVLGVQYGRERSGAERVIGVNVAWPIGAASRSAQAVAQLAEAESAQAELEELRRNLRADLARWQAEAIQSLIGAQASAHALSQTELAEAALRRGQALGQVSVSEVLLMQRQLIDQRQLAAQAQVEAWTASRRWLLESGRLWAQPPLEADVAALQLNR